MASSTFRKEGDYWTIAFRGPDFRLKDSKGLRYLGRLLANPGREILALDLTMEGGAGRRSSSAPGALDEGVSSRGHGDAGEILDPEARSAYKRRLQELRREIEEAEGFNDSERAAWAGQEAAALERELAAAFGIGGKARRAKSITERARVNVRNSITSALRSIARHDADLAEHLSQAVRTGTYCSYVSEAIAWSTDVPKGKDGGLGKRPDRFLATVLFTDIVASTERAAALGDRRWRELLDQHDVIAHSAIEECEGRVVNSFGDSVFATFPRPADAIGSAIRMGRALEPLDVQIRAGVHVGECERRGDDVGGITVHICARVLALASSREILTTSTVRDLVAGSDLSFEDRGFHALRGVPGTWRLFAASHGHSPARSRPLASGAFSIMLVDDHPMWRETLRKVVEHSCPATVVAEAGDGPEAIEMARAARPDVVVMDMNLPTMTGPDATRGILAELPDTRVLVLSSSDEQRDVLEAVGAGATGYLVKTASPADVADGIRRVHENELVFPPALAGIVVEEFRRLAKGQRRRTRSGS